MRIPLCELDPAWLESGSRTKLGVAFLCPECGQHRIDAWFFKPADGGDPPTLTESIPTLYWHEGEELEVLSMYPPVRHGAEAMIVIYEGVTNVVYF